jgi:hypothetical protein
MPFFSICLLTYNRPVYLKTAITSILQQTFTDFELLVLDNGSTDPAVSLYLATITDPRVTVVRSDRNLDTNVVLESALLQFTGQFVFPFFADDDAMSPIALETVATVIRAQPEIDYLSLGLVRYDHRSHKCDAAEGDDFDGTVRPLNGQDEFWRFCYAWGISGRTFSKQPIWRAHSSALVLTRELLNATKAKQKTIYVSPFGDVGLAGALLCARQPVCVKVPLIVIGIHTARSMSQAGLRNRRLCDKNRDTLSFCPVKAPTFFSLGAESHLKVIHLHGLETHFVRGLRPWFFVVHFAYLLLDRIIDRRTFLDLREAAPFALKSLSKFLLPSIRECPCALLHLMRKAYSGTISRGHLSFPSIHVLLTFLKEQVRRKPLDRASLVMLDAVRDAAAPLGRD